MLLLSHMRKDPQQSASSAREHHIAELYDRGISACNSGDRKQVRSALIELIGSLNFENGGDLTMRLHALYEFCLNETGDGELDVIRDLLINLRTSWMEGAKPRTIRDVP